MKKNSLQTHRKRTKTKNQETERRYKKNIEKRLQLFHGGAKKVEVQKKWTHAQKIEALFSTKTPI